MVDPKLARAYGTLAGLGFIGVAALTLPSTRLLDPAPAPEAYLLTLLGLVTGLICIGIPWDRLDPRWLHLIGVVATVEAAATVEVFGQQYVAFFFLIAVLVAYVSPDARTLGLQLGLICVAIVGPVLYGSADTRSSLNVALVAVPIMLLTAGLFSYLRLKMVHDRRAYHRFAEQTLVLSSQIAGRQVGPARLPRHDELVPQISLVRPPGTAIAVVAAVLGIPLFAGGLAAAGVKLPAVASDSFERLGISLPNQEDESEAGPPRGNRPQPKRVAAAAETPGATTGARAAKPPGEGESAGGPNPQGEAKAATVEPSPTVSAQPTPEPEPDPKPPEAPAGNPAEPAPLEALLDEATQGLQGLLDQLR